MDKSSLSGFGLHHGELGDIIRDFHAWRSKFKSTKHFIQSDKKKKMAWKWLKLPLFGNPVS